MEQSKKKKGFYLSDQEIKDKILSYYNFKVINIENIKYKDTDKERAVYKIETDKGIKCLKKVYFDKPVLLFIYSIIEWLNLNGVLCPRLNQTINFKRYVSYKNKLYIVTDWVEGEKLSYDKEEDIVKAAFNLARIHKTSYGFKPIDGSITSEILDDYYDSLQKKFYQLLEVSNSAFLIGDKFSRIMIEHLDYNISTARDSLYYMSLVDFNNFGDRVSKNAICHLDYVNKNLIFTPDGKLYVIDFDKSKMDYPIRDITSFLRRILKRKKTSWSLEICIMAIESYEKVRSLSYMEHLTLLSLLAFPNKFYKLTRDYYKNIKKCNRDAFVSILTKINEQDEDHKLFCQGFKKYIEDKFDMKI